jgi:predicted kinase
MTFYIIIRGPLGCGKSTLAEKISKLLKAKYISMDRVLDDHDLIKEWEEGYISQNCFKKANEIVALKAKQILKHGQPLVFDGNFYWKSQIEDLIIRLKCPHYVFTLKLPLKECIERDSKRKKKHTGKMQLKRFMQNLLHLIMASQLM